MAEPSPDVIDGRVLERFADALGDRAPVREALDRWLAALPVRLDAIRTASDGGAVRSAAERLESPSAALGLAAVAGACHAITHATGAATANADLLDALDGAVATTKLSLAAWT